MKQKLAVFVDVQNIYYTTRQVYKQHFDYNRFWQSYVAEHDVVVANAYAIASPQDKQRQFHNILRGIGFNVKLKPFITRADGSAKGDWDVGITIDVMEIASSVDRVFLLSGDGDFDLLVAKVQDSFKVPVTVFGVPQTSSNSLQQTASSFVGIEQELLLPAKKY